MPAFEFVARDREGRLQRGREEGLTANSVVSTLRGRGWAVVDVQPIADAASAPTWQSLRPSQWLRVRSLDIELSLQQLAVMLHGGLTLLSAMQTVAEQCTRAKAARIWQAVVEDVQRGSGLAEALKRHPKIPHIVVELVRIGEQTGALEPVLRRGAEALERRRTLRNSLLTALAYPTLVLVAALGVATFMVVNVIPKLQVFLTSLGRKLPAMTQFLLDVSDSLRIYGPTLLVLSAATVTGFIACYLWPPGRLRIDRMLLRLPLVGWFLRLAATALLARSLATLLHSGVTLLEGLKTVESLHSNTYLRQQLVTARMSVMSGGSLAGALRATGVYMPMLSAMTAVGESAGTLDDVLHETARFLEDQFQSAVRRLSTIIEPVIIVVVGSIVGFIYIAFFVALFAVGRPG
ncbi:MAG TPA: type II secretion system F family protein [Pirellulaceae bacterium]|nr:type II secretion system F family protein [Pirellulaceae bacterium]